MVATAASPFSRIDINCDMAELPELAASGVQGALLAAVSSVNVSCGAHAGSPALIEETIRAAVSHGVAVGAHPGFPDPANFGRIPLDIGAEALGESLDAQLRLIAEIASKCGASIRHVKPHGALYNLAARDEGLAWTIAQSIRKTFPDAAVMMLAGAPTLAMMERAGLVVIPEAFADRAYEADGSLRNRRHPDALITLPEAAAAQALSIACDSRALTLDGGSIPVVARTLCVHSDTPGAPAIAMAVRTKLESAGFRITPANP